MYEVCINQTITASEACCVRTKASGLDLGPSRARPKGPRKFVFKLPCKRLGQYAEAEPDISNSPNLHTPFSTYSLDPEFLIVTRYKLHMAYEIKLH